MAELPLLRSDKEAGSVILHVRQDYSIYDTLFSYTLYYRKSLEEFQQSIYYEALKIYAEFIHNGEHPTFEKTGMILYTDTASLPILMASFAAYPKVIIAQTVWPQFMTSEQTIDDTVLRAMRYHAIEAFPHAKILIRDADSLFPYEIKRLKVIERGGKPIQHRSLETGKFIDIEDPDKQLEKRIAMWEIQFLEKWDSKIPIVIGTDKTYFAVWHYNTAFKYTPKPNNIPNFSVPIFQPNVKNMWLKSIIKDKVSKFAFTDIHQGLFAGFVNLAANRPQDIWQLIYNYIAPRYEIINNNSGKKIISNAHSLIPSIGKDERALLFAVLPQYIDITYFYNIIYYGGSDPEDNDYRPPIIGIKYPIFRTAAPEGSNDPWLYVNTTLLRPDYHSAIDTPATHAEYLDRFMAVVAAYRRYIDRISTKTNDELQALTGANTLRPTRRLRGGRRKTRRRRPKA